MKFTIWFFCILGAEVRPRMLLNMNANRPFMYYIRDRETNTIVFNGRIETV